jgi:hypothetical protein
LIVIRRGWALACFAIEISRTPLRPVAFTFSVSTVSGRMNPPMESSEAAFHSVLLQLFLVVASCAALVPPVTGERKHSVVQGDIDPLRINTREIDEQLETVGELADAAGIHSAVALLLSPSCRFPNLRLISFCSCEYHRPRFVASALPSIRRLPVRI